MQPVPETLEIIAQPYYKGKLRYRSDYEKNKNRRGVLQSRNNSNYRNPTIRVSLFNRSLDSKNASSFRSHRYILILRNNIIFVFVLQQLYITKQIVVMCIHTN